MLWIKGQQKENEVCRPSILKSRMLCFLHKGKQSLASKEVATCGNVASRVLLEGVRLLMVTAIVANSELLVAMA